LRGTPALIKTLSRSAFHAPLLKSKYSIKLLQQAMLTFFCMLVLIAVYGSEPGHQDDIENSVNNYTDV